MKVSQPVKKPGWKDAPAWADWLYYDQIHRAWCWDSGVRGLEAYSAGNEQFTVPVYGAPSEDAEARPRP